MSARRWITITLGKTSPLALARGSNTPKTGMCIACLQERTCQAAWNPSPLRAFGTSSQIFHQAIGRIKIQKLSEIIKYLSKKRTYRLHIEDSKPPQKMRQFMNDAVNLLLKTPASAIVTVFTGSCAFSFHNFHKEHLVKLPLNDRMAFIVQTDEEALDNSEVQAKLLMNEALNGPNRQPWLLDGENIDPSLLRLENILKRLREANPELTQHLMPGGVWRLHMKLHSGDLSWGVGRSFGCGMLVFAADMVPKLDDDELAFIMAHEMTHAVQRHENECWSINSFFFHYFYNVMMPIKLELETGKDIREYLGGFTKALARLGFNFMDPHTWEREADEFAFKFASKACFDYRKFGQVFPKVVKLNASARAGAPSKQRKKFDPHDQSVSEKDWVMYSMQTSDFYARNIHDSTTVRADYLGSKEMLTKGEDYRRDGNCLPLNHDPVKAVKELSQKVEELVAEWKARQTGQGQGQMGQGQGQMGQEQQVPTAG